MEEVESEEKYENGEFLIKCKEEISNLPSILCGLCDQENEEYLHFICKCYGCNANDLICKQCSQTCKIFTHLCCCFRQKNRHLWYNLNIVWGKKGM